MLEKLSLSERGDSIAKIYHDFIHLKTMECLQFLDLTPLITKLVENSRVQNGLLNVQTMHTTTAILVNENEPLLLQDMRNVLEKIVPQDAEYQHNNFGIRTVNLEPQEEGNGHSHCRALFLRTSETLNILGGKIQLGRWQRLFFVELDRARERTVSILIMGHGAES